MQLLQRFKGWDFATAAAEVDKVIGRVPAEASKPALDPAKRRDMLNRLWTGAALVTRDSPVMRYLSSRGLIPPSNIDVLRYAASCPVPGGGEAPALLAKVQAPDGSPATLHRTFLRADGLGKADMDQPRAVMPGEIPDGSAIRLSTYHHTRLGIAEGIETALAAAARFDMPVWAAINATMLAKWEPPQDVNEVTIFADNDDSLTGQAAAFVLGRRLRLRRRIAVRVEIPPAVGTDWADMMEAAE